MEKNKKLLRIIFIANAPLSSKKVSTYQTLCQAQSLSKECTLILFMPNRHDLIMEGREDIFSQAYSILGIEKKINFEIKAINYFDLFKHQWINHHLRFAISNFMYAYSSIKEALKFENELIYTRDFYTMIILSTLKYFKLIKNKVAFESHQFSKIRKFFIKNINFLIVINSYQKELYKHKKSIVLHDCVWAKEIRKSPIKKYEKNSIFFSGSCTKSKGIERILHLSNNLLDYKFYIASLENYKDDNLPSKLYKKNVTWLGRLNRSEIFSFLERMQFCILPNELNDENNLYTSPMKLFEYLSSGKAIIASPINSVKEILDKDSYYSLPNDIKNFPKFAKLLRESNPEEISKKYHEVIQKFTWENRAKKFINFIKS